LKLVHGYDDNVWYHNYVYSKNALANWFTPENIYILIFAGSKKLKIKKQNAQVVAVNILFLV